MGDLVSWLHGGPRLGARAAFWCAWSLWALSVVTTATLLAYSAIHPLPAKIRGGPAEVVIAVAFIGGFATVGALLGWKRPANPIGWLMCGTALSYTAGNVGQLLLSRFARTQALGDWLGWAWLFGIGLVAVVLLLFPTGALPSRRWRPVAWAAAAGLAGWVLGNAFAPKIFSADSRPANPFGIGGVAGKVFLILAGGGAALIALSAVAAIVSLVFRYRHARMVEREQLKWLVYAAGLIVVAFLASIGASSQLQNAVTSGAIAAVPVAIGVAVFRYHLYDIDVVINKTLVYGSLAAFITGVYVAMVVGIGSLLQPGTRPSLGLSILATAVVAVAFQPVRERVQRLANRLVYGKRATPYEALSTFAGQLGTAVPAGDLLPQLARVLADATGAARTQVWLADGGQFRLEAAYPADDQHEPERRRVPVPLPPRGLPAFPGVTMAFEVSHAGERLGALTLAKRPGEALTPVEGRLAAQLAGQAGLVLHNAGLTGQLKQRLAELHASRRRIVEAADGERRRLERNIHDGAQQQLVALSVMARLAESSVGSDKEGARAMVAQAQVDAAGALENLRDLARGIYPPLLAEHGLAAALEAQASRSPFPVTVDVDRLGRYPPEAEAAVYFCMLEALQNIAKYAAASRAAVRLAGPSGLAGALQFSVTDDGAGFDTGAAGYGTGLQGMADRLAALGGDLQVRSEPGHGTTVTGRLPVRALEPVP
jgi:signal transduction histidine kinase